MAKENPMFSGARGSQNEESMFNSLVVQFYKTKKFWEWMVLLVSQKFKGPHPCNCAAEKSSNGLRSVYFAI